MIYIIAILGALLAFGGWTLYQRNEAVNEYKADFESAQKVIDAQAKKLEQEAENHITDMEAAYEVGESEARVITKTITARGASDVAKYAVFDRPECVLPAASLLNLAAARAGVRPAADTGEVDAGVPGPAAGQGRTPSNAVPADVGGREPVPAMPAPARPANSSSALPGSGVQGHPKPTPIH